MKKTAFYIFLAAALLCSCEDNTTEVERPLYPTEGAVNARYTIGDDVTVVFAKGNLQYQASSKTWRFANNQYDVIGYANEFADTAYSGWIDLFGWGTSGYEGLMPYSVSDTSLQYVSGEYDIAGTQYDWGVHNAISNGGNKVGQWRCMSYDEWSYLFNYREQAKTKRALATIQTVGLDGGDMHGLLLLPDKWVLPADCSFHYGADEGFATNVYSVSQWNKMQGAGAVFLPAGGERTGRHVTMVGDYGCYWTTTYYTDESAYELYMLSSEYSFYTTGRASGHSVRLVMEK